MRALLEVNTTIRVGTMPHDDGSVLFMTQAAMSSSVRMPHASSSPVRPEKGNFWVKKDHAINGRIARTGRGNVEEGHVLSCHIVVHHFVRVKADVEAPREQLPQGPLWQGGRQEQLDDMQENERENRV